jgi:hypothetical protein
VIRGRPWLSSNGILTRVVGVLIGRWTSHIFKVTRICNRRFAEYYETGTDCEIEAELHKGVSIMAVLIEDIFPVGVSVEFLDAVTDEMGVDGNLPSGGVMHAHFERDGRAQGVDVWESVEAYDQFVQSTLMPAMGKVAAAKGLDPSKMGEPEVKITEIHRLVR